jgi:predicted amidohydrolase YtcJ
MTTPVGEPHYFIRRSYKDLKERELPTREVLDRATDKHPVIIQAWVPNIPNTVAFNSMALERLGLTRELPDQVGDVTIEKDQNGEPTGRLHGAVNDHFGGDEFAYQLWRKIPVADYRLVTTATRRAIAKYHGLGVTTIYENHMMNRRQLDVYRALRNAGQLGMRVMASQESESYGTAWSRRLADDEFIRGLENAASSIELRDDYFRFNGLSVAWDGGCYPGYMMMRENYYGPDGKETHGRYVTDPRRIETVMRFCIRLNTLCIGTQANEQNLELLENLAETHDIRPLRWVLVHTPFIEEGQVKRYQKLNFDVTTTMTFLFGMGDLFRRRFKPNLCEGMLEDLLPLRRLFDARLAVGGGTDWGPQDVFEQVQLALTHTMPSGYSNLGMAQSITRTQAVSMWTRDAARLLQWEGIGSLSAGDHADLVIVDRDPITCAVDDIGNTRVLKTLIDGETVYDAGAL